MLDPYLAKSGQTSVGVVVYLMN